MVRGRGGLAALHLAALAGLHKKYNRAVWVGGDRGAVELGAEVTRLLDNLRQQCTPQLTGP